MTDLELLRKHGHILTDNQHAAFELAARGLSERQIAAALDLSRSAVQSRLENARRRLDNALRETEDHAA